MKNWKRAVALALTILSLSSTTTVFAAEVLPLSPRTSKSSSARAEEKEWVYRTLADGTRQRRLWSYTRGIWITEWQKC
ncbi:hypothetical protein [Pygmaiobacter massiliensis]|uniref:hypothetical protein n=1 Tax=Pygmaiobacter massiliensis TaxID=1917873 RepID=UPI00289675F0|nr:hypothetical protein [Pygmaiobacter massiliensis]